MPLGTVKWFNAEKGFGFITPEGTGNDLFVHYSGIAATGYRELKEGQRVDYQERPGKKGMEAYDVSVRN